jgi:hypothetical protein
MRAAAPGFLGQAIHGERISDKGNTMAHRRVTAGVSTVVLLLAICAAVD